MRRVLDIRITRWELKLLYVVGAIVVGFVIAGLLRAWGVAETIVLLTTAVLDIAALFLGARIFRGRGEAIRPPRFWWRMTARPTLSRRLGVFFVVGSALGVIGLVLEAIDVPAFRRTGVDGLTTAESILVVLEYGVIAYFYLNSAVRLKRLGVPAQEPKFRPTVKLKQ